MNIGESAHASVRAKTYWNKTGITLHPNCTYRLLASGTWIDFLKRCFADGYASGGILVLLRPLERWRRVPNANWFALIGTLDSDPATAFIIGTGRDLVAERAGQLVCFANDAPWAYFNNCGEIELRVTRIA